jgi:hypothetical protein
LTPSGKLNAAIQTEREITGSKQFAFGTVLQTNLAVELTLQIIMAVAQLDTLGQQQGSPQRQDKAQQIAARRLTNSLTLDYSGWIQKAHCFPAVETIRRLFE